MKTTRFIAFLLVLVFAFGALCACGDEPADTTKRPPVTGGEELDSKWNDVDFDGDVLRIGYNEKVNKSVEEAGAPNSLKYLRGSDDEEDLTNAVYVAATTRFDYVTAVLGIDDVIFTNANWDMNCDSIITYVEAQINAMTGEEPDIVIHHNYGMVRAGILGYLYNAKGTYDKETNYFDLTDEGWYLDTMLENTLDSEKIYMLMGDYLIDNFRMAYGVLANIDIIDDVYAGVDDMTGMETLYEEIRRGYWTYDKMMEIAELGYDDNGTPGALDNQDILGVVAEEGWIVRSFFATSGLDIFEINQTTGQPQYRENPTDVFEWVEKLLTMDRESYFYLDWNNASLRENPTKTFIAGRTVFATNQMVLSLEGNRIQGMDDRAALLPDPKYVKPGVTSTTPEYHALISDNASSAGILITGDFTMSSAFLQLITEQSDDMMYQYYEVALKFKYNTSTSSGNSTALGHIEMLEYIHDGICSPMSFLYDNYCAKSIGLDTYAALMYNSFGSGENTFTSDWARDIDAKVFQWADIIKEYGEYIPK